MRIEQGALKVINLVGISPISFEDAVKQAVIKASSTIDHVAGVEIVSFSAKVDGTDISEYHADVKLAFVVK